MSQLSTRVTARLKAFRKDSRANVFMLMGFALVPITMAAGIATDYARAARLKTRLDAAADSAALQAVAESSTFISDKSACERAVALFAVQVERQADVMVNDASFKVSIGSPYKPNNSVYNPVTKRCSEPEEGSEELSAARVVSVSYDVQSKNYFGAMVNKPTLKVAGWVKSDVSVPNNIDIYLALDTSPSMGFPAYQDGINKMLDTVTCAFACHTNVGWGQIQYEDPTTPGHKRYKITPESPARFGVFNGNPVQYIDAENNFFYKDGKRDCSTDVDGKQTCTIDWSVYKPTGKYIDSLWYARHKGIVLRIDELRRAAEQVILTATNEADRSDATYRVGMYTFNYEENFQEIFSLKEVASKETTAEMSLNATTARNIAHSNAIELETLDELAPHSGGCPKTHCTGNNRYKFTSFKGLFEGMMNKLPNKAGYGTRSALDSPLAVMIVVTDGMSDEISSLVDGEPTVQPDYNRTARGLTGSLVSTPSPKSHQAMCQAIKRRNIKIAILYTEYLPESINDDSAYMHSVRNDGVPTIEPALRKCASPGLMMKVTTNEDIAAKLSQLMKKSVASPKLIR